MTSGSRKRDYRSIGIHFKVHQERMSELIKEGLCRDDASNKAFKEIKEHKFTEKIERLLREGDES